MSYEAAEGAGGPGRARAPGGRRTSFALTAAGFGALFLAIPAVPPLAPVLSGAATGLLGVAVAVNAAKAAGWAWNHVSAARFRRLLDDETGAALLSDAGGLAIALNAEAAKSPRLARAQRVSTFLDAVVVEPDATVARLAAKALASGGAGEKVGTRSKPMEISVRRVGRDRLIWRFDEGAAQSASGCPDLPFPVIGIHAGTGALELNAEACRRFGPVSSLSELLGDAPPEPGRILELELGPEPRTAVAVEFPSAGGIREFGLVPATVGIADAKRAGHLLAGPQLLEALPVPMLKIDADGTLIEANAEARAIFALGDGALPPLFELVEGMGRPIADWLADAAGGRGLLKPEIVRAVIPGQELFLQIALGRSVEPDGKVVLVGILNDATELKTLEAQFVQSQKMQAIGQLAGGVAHDFNNLLTAISGHCDLLLLRHDAGDPDYADLIQISQNANRAASLVGQLLAFSRKQNLKPQALDIRDTMSDLAHLLNRLIGERIRLDVIHAPGAQTIRADRRQLEQVIVNLVVNARDAMPDGGTITVSTRTESFDHDVVRDQARVPAGNYVVIEVRDAGVGISPEGLSKIFEPFYTTKKTGEGTGLGLSTAYGIVKQTGGFIFADSVPGHGATFRLYFPAFTPKPEVAEAEAPARHAPRAERGDGVVLLVEDEAPVRAFAGRALRLRGYTVIEAENAEEALATLEDGKLRVDIFVTDVVMPGMDGPTWVRQALKQRPDTKVVFTSGYSEEGRVEKQARIPNSVFLPKPFSLAQLTSTVQEQLM